MLFCFVAASCKYTNGKKKELITTDGKIDIPVKKWALKDFYSDEKQLAFLVDSIYNSIDDDEKAAQLIMPAVSDQIRNKYPFSKILALYGKKLIGGVLFLKNKTGTVKDEMLLLKHFEDSLNLLPLIYTCDGEPALFHKKFTDTDSLKKASEQITLSDVLTATKAVSGQIKAMNLNWNFAPVGDLSFNEAIIGNRSFGSNKEDVIQKCCLFINTSNQFNIVTSLKHFPGHGDVIGDSHKGIVTINGAMNELECFRKIIEIAKPISVMVGHIAVNNRTRFNTKGLPSSLSKIIVTDLLKDSLNFNGIKVTDAMGMGAVKDIPDADFKAIQAGNDVVVMPKNVQLLHDQIGMILKQNSGLKIQVVESIKKIIRLKICAGVIKL